MNESIHKYFKVGTIQWMTHPPKDYELLDSLKTIACDDFFDAIEVTQVKDDALREKAKKILDQSHLTSTKKEERKQKQHFWKQLMKQNIWEQVVSHSWQENGKKRPKIRLMSSY